MKCPKCESTSYRKNGRRSGQQSYLCKNCGRQFLEPSEKRTLSEAGGEKRTGISVLLLDAENLKLNINIETFLAGICRHDLQVKIAFANWRNPTIGKHDIELYERGYQLVHVPAGKNSADGKMIATGSSILRQYPTVKEVFVCSCDQILTHLCNQLQNQGLTVYWVRRQAQSLKVENRNTGQVSHYSLAMEMSIPSFEAFVQKIEDLIKVEQASISDRLSNLTMIATLFQERCNLTPNGNRSNSVNEIIPILEIDEEKVESNTTTIITDVSSINSKEDLEKTLIEIIHSLEVKSPQAQLSVAMLGTELRRISGQTPNSIVKKLKLGSSFTKFLHSCSIFKLKKTDEQYEVVIAQR